MTLQNRQQNIPEIIPARSAALTKADTVALWHAVTALSYQVSAMREIETITPEQIEAERARLLAAKRALRKVNQLRKEGVQLANLRKSESGAKP